MGINLDEIFDDPSLGGPAALQYKGTWNATTNIPVLSDITGVLGDFYIVSVAGTQDLGSGNIVFAIGDWALHNGTAYEKIPNAVASVFGRTGVIVALVGDYAAFYAALAHAASHTDGTDDIQSATSGQKGVATAAQITKLDGIEALADVTDAANVSGAGAVMEVDFDATTFMYALADDTPLPKTPAEVMAILSNEALAAFDMNLQNLIDCPELHMINTKFIDIGVSSSIVNDQGGGLTFGLGLGCCSGTLWYKDLQSDGGHDAMGEYYMWQDGGSVYPHFQFFNIFGTLRTSGDVCQIVGDTFSLTTGRLLTVYNDASGGPGGSPVFKIGKNGKITSVSGTDINEFSIDGALAGNSDDAIPTEKAVKTYADLKIAKALFDANTILTADTDDTPAAVVVAEQRIVGRITAGNIKGMTAAEVVTMLGATEREFMVNAFQYPNPGNDWTAEITGAVLGVSQTAAKCWIPLNFLKIGDKITSYKLVGDMHEEGGDTNTLDCKLVRVNLADPLTTTDVAGGGIVQVDADGNFDVEAVLGAQETVATDKQYLLEITGTTTNVSGNESIKVMGAEVKVDRL